MKSGRCTNAICKRLGWRVLAWSTVRMSGERPPWTHNTCNMFNWISSVLTWDTYRLSCSAFQQNIGTKWKLSYKCKLLDEKGLEQYPPIYDSWQGQVVKHISAVTPGIWVPIFPLALVIKAIHLHTQSQDTSYWMLQTTFCLLEVVSCQRLKNITYSDENQ
jgi:hypothetical protein